MFCWTYASRVIRILNIAQPSFAGLNATREKQPWLGTPVPISPI